MVEKMGPLRGDGNCNENLFNFFLAGREDGSPSWGRKSLFSLSYFSTHSGREDGSPSWGRKFCTGCALAEFSK